LVWLITKNMQKRERKRSSRKSSSRRNRSVIKKKIYKKLRGGEGGGNNDNKVNDLEIEFLKNVIFGWIGLNSLATWKYGKEYACDQPTRCVFNPTSIVINRINNKKYRLENQIDCINNCADNVRCNIFKLENTNLNFFVFGWGHIQSSENTNRLEMFYKTIVFIVDIFSDYLQNNNQNNKIILCGHSAGFINAIYIAYILSCDIQEIYSVLEKFDANNDIMKFYLDELSLLFKKLDFNKIKNNIIVVGSGGHKLFCNEPETIVPPCNLSKMNSFYNHRILHFIYAFTIPNKLYFNGFTRQPEQSEFLNNMDGLFLVKNDDDDDDTKNSSVDILSTDGIVKKHTNSMKFQPNKVLHDLSGYIENFVVYYKSLQEDNVATISNFTTVAEYFYKK
jgi:hypothetical protein